MIFGFEVKDTTYGRDWGLELCQRFDIFPWWAELLRTVHFQYIFWWFPFYFFNIFFEDHFFEMWMNMNENSLTIGVLDFSPLTGPKPPRGNDLGPLIKNWLFSSFIFREAFDCSISHRSRRFWKFYLLPESLYRVYPTDDPHDLFLKRQYIILGCLNPMTVSFDRLVNHFLVNRHSICLL